MALISRANPRPLTEIAGASLTGSYQSFYTATDDVIILLVTSTLSEDFYLSFDGINDYYKLSSSNKGFIIDFQSNVLRLPKPTLYIKHAGVLPSGWLAVSPTELTT